MAMARCHYVALPVFKNDADGEDALLDGVPRTPRRVGVLLPASLKIEAFKINRMALTLDAVNVMP
jgi:hypothetical protein